MSLSPFFVICGLVCLFWLMAHWLLASRLESFHILAMLLLMVFLGAAGDVLLGAITGYDVFSFMVVLIAAPSIIQLSCLYLAHLVRPLPSRPIHFIWIVVPIVLFTASIILTGLLGLDHAESIIDGIREQRIVNPRDDLSGIDRTYFIWMFDIFRSVMLLETLNLVVYCCVMMQRTHCRPANWIGFLFKGRKMRVAEIQLSLSLLILAGFSVKIFMHFPFYLHYPLITVIIVVLMAFLLFFFGLFALFGSREYMTLEDIGTALRFNYSNANRAQMAEEVVMDAVDDLSQESLSQVISRMVMQSDTQVNIIGAPSLAAALFGNTKSWDEGSLVTRFQRLMMDDQLFLQPGLSLETVAARLKSNKTYISKMVNQTYGIGFPEVLNILRVDYAQQYIRRNPDANQEAIARSCGFQSASSFNTTFKRITGFTPKVWASRITKS